MKPAIIISTAMLLTSISSLFFGYKQKEDNSKILDEISKKLGFIFIWYLIKKKIKLMKK